jgi:hypothetical protein
MDNDIAIRKCTKADFDQVLKLLQQFWPDAALLLALKFEFR